MSEYANVVLMLTATLNCNFRCPWCIRDKLNQKYGISLENMTVDTAKKILRDHPVSDVIVLTGGEPMLNREVVDYVCSTGREVKISTNGSIPLWEGFNLHDKVNFDISMNSLERPPLYQQLLDLKFNKNNIRLFVFLNEDYQKVVDIINKVGKDEFRGYEILPDMWQDYSDEYESLIKKSAPAFAELVKKYDKDDGYICYGYQNPKPCIKLKFGVNGEHIRDLWTQQLPEDEMVEMSQHIFNDQNVMRTGLKSFEIGKEAFNMPVEYYTVLMYEEMKKCLELH